MKRNRHIRKLWSGLLALPFLMAACTLHEEPELTADGELGVDPTEVNVEVNLTLDLNLPEQGNEENSSARVSANTDYLHRFIVEAYLNRQPFAGQHETACPFVPVGGMERLCKCRDSRRRFALQHPKSGTCNPEPCFSYGQY